MNDTITNIIFADAGKTAIKVFYEDGRVEVKSYIPDHPLIKELLGGLSEFDIELKTNNFAKKERDIKKHFDEYLEQKDRPPPDPIIIERDKSFKQVVSMILDSTITKDELFDFKIEVLEYPEITDKAMKTKIRKSKDVLEILSLIYQARSSS